MLTHLHTLNEKEAERVGGGKWRKFIYNALPQVLKPTTLCNTPHPSTHPSSCYTSLLTDSHFDTHAPISGFHRPEKLLDLAIQLLSPARLHRIAFEIHALYIFIVFFSTIGSSLFSPCLPMNSPLAAYLSTLWLWLLLVTFKVGRKVEVNNSFRKHILHKYASHAPS